MDTCVFCRIVRGELPASVIHEDEHTLAFMNIMAGNPGHALVIVKPHVENIYTLDDALAAAVFRTTTRVAKAVRA
ncbi:MAG TPA: HIT domain-containing protein, partial [Rhodocyclaceae bacterium]|nr:HIT domain-containing protein [Rhodocyclaceae bacterium]